MDARSIFQERSGIRAVEPADSYRGYQLRVEVPKIDAMLRAGPHLKRLPVSDAAAMPAADRAQSSVALDVGLGRVGMAFDLHRSEREVHPGAANPAADRAVAVRGDFGRRRQPEADGAAVA